MHLSLAAAFALSLLVVPAFAQTGRTVELGTSPSLGAISSYTARYPVAAAGRIGAYGMTLPFPSALPLTLPGITSNGLVRIDLANVLVQGLWLLDNTGAHTWTVPVPNSAAFQGLSFDVQSLDVDLAVTDFAWSDNDLSLTIGIPCMSIVGRWLYTNPASGQWCLNEFRPDFSWSTVASSANTFCCSGGSWSVSCPIWTLNFTGLCTYSQDWTLSASGTLATLPPNHVMVRQ